MTATTVPLVETTIEDPRWDGFGLQVLAESAARAALSSLGIPPKGFEISLLGCDDTRIASLNTEFRGKLNPTNVLSWPSEDRAAATDGATPATPDADELGDIAIAWDTCAQEAADQGKNMRDHVTHLLVHGVLHLLGYDHIRDKDAALMEAAEIRILASMGVSDPYEEGGGKPPE